MVPVGCVPPHSSLHSHRRGLYLPVSVIGEDLIAGQVQLVPLQQQLQLPIPVIPVVLVGAESCRGGTTSGKDQAHLSSLLLTRPGQDSFQVSFPKLMHICLTGGWRMLEAQGHIYGPRQATKELLGASHNQDQHSASFRLLSVLHPLHRNSAGFPMGPYQHPKGSPKCIPNYLVWILPPLRDPMLLLEPAHTPLEKDKLHTVAGA